MRTVIPFLDFMARIEPVFNAKHLAGVIDGAYERTEDPQNGKEVLYDFLFCLLDSVWLSAEFEDDMDSSKQFSTADELCYCDAVRLYIAERILKDVNLLDVLGELADKGTFKTDPWSADEYIMYLGTVYSELKRIAKKGLLG